MTTTDIGRRGFLTAIGAAGTAASLGAAAGCGAKSGTKESSRHLTIGLTQGPQNLDPAKDGSGPNIAIRALTYESITHQKPNGSIGPALATRCQYVGTGNKTFEFTLRHDARFADGSTVNAPAVKKWFEYYPTAKGPASNWLVTSSVQAVDEWTVRLHLASPNPIVPQLLSEQWTPGAVVAPSALADPKRLGTTSAGAGPYVLVPAETVVGDHYTYLPNRHYYDKSRIKFDKIVARVITDPRSMLQSATAGQLQIAVGDVGTADAAAKAGLQVIHEPAGSVGLVLEDLAGKLTKPLADVRVRQALNYAIDRSSITKGLLGRYGTPTAQMQTSDGYDPTYDNYYTYDPKKARALLAQAGYGQGFTLKVVSQGSWGTIGDPLVRAIAKNLAAVGVTMEITEGSTDAQWGQLAVSGTFPAFELVNDSLPTWETYNTLINTNFFKATPDHRLTKLWNAAATAADVSTSAKRLALEMTKNALFLEVLIVHRIWFTASNIGGLAFSSKTEYPIATDWFAK